MSINNATTNKQLTTVTVTVPQTPGTKGSKAGKHVLSALSWGQLFSITLTKYASKKCYQHFACEWYNSCLQLDHWRQQLLPASGFDTQARLKHLRVGSMTTKVVMPTGNLTCR